MSRGSWFTLPVTATEHDDEEADEELDEDGDEGCYYGAKAYAGEDEGEVEILIFIFASGLAARYDP